MEVRIMDNGTKLRTLLAIASSINTALIATDVTGFNSPEIDYAYKVISLVLNFIIVALATYFNNDYTAIAAEKTAELRQAKKEVAADYAGESFFNDDDEDDDEDEDEV